MRRYFLRGFLAVLGIAAATAMVVSDADARAKFGGSRGTRTFSAPSATPTAPTASPLNRTMTQPGQPSATATRSGAAAAAPAAGGMFGRPGFLGGLAAGFLGAGLIGLLAGNGLFGGLGGLASFLGLLVQAGLIALAVMLVWRWWQRRNAPAMAGGPSLRDIAGTHGAHDAPANRMGASTLGGLGSALGGRGPSPQPAAFGTDDVTIGPDDYDAFERLLGDLQKAYGAEDLAALRKVATPEMVSYFAEDLADNASRGVINEIGAVKLVQGDLSEAWREDGVEYATVAMRYAIEDRTVDRATGREVEKGSAEATEFWTFRRARGGEWIVSAIQDTA